MGRKRINELEAGGKTTLYIPQDVDPAVLEYLRGQKNLSKTLLDLAYDKVYGRTDIEPANIKELVSELVSKELKKNSPGGEEEKGVSVSTKVGSDKKAEAIRSMNRTMNFE